MFLYRNARVHQNNKLIQSTHFYIKRSYKVFRFANTTHETFEQVVLPFNIPKEVRPVFFTVAVVRENAPGVLCMNVLE